jgi:hypothetical protein
MNPYLTRVRLTSTPKQSRFWLRFGRPHQEHPRHRLQRYLFFTPQSVFCTVRWHGNEYGTTLWQLSILRAVAPWEPAAMLMDVDPGAEVLLRVSSKANIRQVLALIKEIEALPIHPSDVSPDYWRTLQNRIVARDVLPQYSLRQHQAYQLFQRLLGAG